jgi:glycerol-3-phosphate cytidylyltransferase
MSEKIIGYTAGCYDLFHIGHLNLLKNARLECDYLIVGVTTDALCLKNKNKSPVITYEERKEIVKAIKYVDEVIAQEDGNKLAAYDKCKFNTIFVGSDWKNTDIWKFYEREFEKVGVEVVYLPYTKTTSSTLVRNVLENSEKGVR